MKKARLIKRHEIKTHETEKETEPSNVKVIKKELGELAELSGRKKRQDPRKAFADLFAQP
jgi:NTP pyrophosphatase (non-canonical NTP hydrolase)